MIKQLVQKHLKMMSRELLQCNNPVIDKFKDDLQAQSFSQIEIDQTLQDILRTIIVSNYPLDEKTILNEIRTYPDKLLYGQTVYVIKAKIKGMNSWRKIQLSATFSITEFALAVIGAFHGEGSKMFCVQTEDHTYLPFSNSENPDELSSEGMLLCHLQFHEKSGIQIVYGQDPSWVFECQLIKTLEQEEGNKELRLIGGKGYPIWEDHRDYLEALIENPEQMVFVDNQRRRRVGLLAQKEDILPFSNEDKEWLTLNSMVAAQNFNKLCNALIEKQGEEEDHD